MEIFRLHYFISSSDGDVHFKSCDSADEAEQLHNSFDEVSDYGYIELTIQDNKICEVERKYYKGKLASTEVKPLNGSVV